MSGSLSFNAFLPPNTPEISSIAAPLGVCRCRESILIFQQLRPARLAYPTIARVLRRVGCKSCDGKWGPGTLWVMRVAGSLASVGAVHESSGVFFCAGISAAGGAPSLAGSKRRGPATMMSIQRKLGLLFGFAVFCQITVLAMRTSTPGEADPQFPFELWPIIALGVLGDAIANFLVAGLIPAVIWSLRRFRCDTEDAVVKGWVVLIVFFAFLQFYS